MRITSEMLWNCVPNCPKRVKSLDVWICINYLYNLTIINSFILWNLVCTHIGAKSYKTLTILPCCSAWNVWTSKSGHKCPLCIFFTTIYKTSNTFVIITLFILIQAPSNYRFLLHPILVSYWWVFVAVCIVQEKLTRCSKVGH